MNLDLEMKWMKQFCVSTLFLFVVGSGSVFAALLGGIATPELTAEEIAALQIPPPEWAEEIEEVDGRMHIVRGDVAFPVDPADLISGGRTDGRGPRSGFRSVGGRWPGGVLYYQFNSNVNTTNRLRFAEAASEWAEAADLVFINSAGTGNYVAVENSTVNTSYIGRIGGAQQLRMYNWNYPYIIMHELGHALGMYHEQSRSDRDAYVTIFEQNVQPGQVHNFDKSNTINFGAYDFLSVMHYSRRAFLRGGLPNGSNTIEPKPAYFGYLNLMGQQDELSQLDKQGMKEYYASEVGEAKPELQDRGDLYHGLGSTTVFPGQSLIVRGDVLNIGRQASGGFRVDFYASSNADITSSDFFLGSRVVSNVGVGEHAAIDTVLTLPGSLPSGSQYVGWIIDSGFNVAEVSESNNRVVITSQQILFPETDDTELSDGGAEFRSLSSVQRSPLQPVNIRGRVSNTGAAASVPFEVAFYLSTNSTITSSDIFIGSHTIEGIASGSFRDFDFENIIPENLGFGTTSVQLRASFEAI